ncbi:MAG: hypothetical protein DRQ48_09830, partial [Gammaproteobacteria bacterium]
NEPIPAPAPAPAPIPEPEPVPASLQDQQPIANDINVDVEFDSALSISILANDTGNGDAINAASIEIVKSPSHGQSAIISNGTVVYMPDTGYSGLDNFTYTVKDKNDALSNVASVNISVNKKNVIASNDLPVSEGSGALNPLMLMWLMIMLSAYRLQAGIRG